MNKSDSTSDYSQVEATKTLTSELFAVGIQFQALFVSLYLRQRLCYLADQLEPLLVTTTGDDTGDLNAKIEAVRDELVSICSEVKNRQQESTTHIKHSQSQMALQVISKAAMLSELTAERNSIQHQTDLVQGQLSAIRKASSADEEKRKTSEPMKEVVSAEFFSLRRKIRLVDRKIRIITFFGLDVWEALEEATVAT